MLPLPPGETKVKSRNATPTTRCVFNSFQKHESRETTEPADISDR
jgi:hypothetical protein